MIAKRLRSGDRLGHLGTNLNPARDAAIQTRANCAIPASGTAQINASPVSMPSFGAAIKAAMKIIFKRTGAAAAATNRPVAFSNPDKSAAKEIKMT